MFAVSLSSAAAPSGPVSSLLDFQDAIAHASVSARCALGERLARRPGAACYEFLLAVHGFGEARNALQRYELLRNIVHRYVRQGAERQVPLSDACRLEVLSEWADWQDRGRVPPRRAVRALKLATAEVSARS